MAHSLFRSLALTAAVASIAACGLPPGGGGPDDTDVDVDVDAPAETVAGLTVRFEASDAASRATALARPEPRIRVNDLDQLVVTVRSVAAHAAGSGWLVVSENPVQVDLLKLDESAAALGFARLPPGKITQIRLFLAEEPASFALVKGETEPRPVRVPSGLQSGIKLKGPFDIEECAAAVVSVQLDLEKSIRVHGRGESDELILRPTIHRVRFDAAPAEECAPAGDPEVIDPGAGEGEGEAPPATPGDDECFGVGFEEGFVACDDADSDHVSDEDEAVEGTDPALADTDGDGLDDGEELAVFFTDPFATDTDGGGKTDGEEVAAGLDPRDPSDDVAAEPGEEENLCQDVEGNFVLCSFP